MLRVCNLGKRYGAERVLENVNLDVDTKQTVSVLGESGSGKTTLLKIVAGLVRPDSGVVEVDGRDVTDVPPEARGTVYLHQEALLFPHLSAFENIAFGLRVRGVGRTSIDERVRRMLLELGLEDHATKPPHQLSGGQRQRVAFGRALIVAPRVLLLDEPFGALDRKTRDEMQELFRRIIHERETTTVFVTHDPKEALRVGDRFAVIDSGRLTTFDAQRDFLDHPRVAARSELEFWSRALDPQASS